MGVFQVTEGFDFIFVFFGCVDLLLIQKEKKLKGMKEFMRVFQIFFGDYFFQQIGQLFFFLDFVDVFYSWILRFGVVGFGFVWLIDDYFLRFQSDGFLRFCGGRFFEFGEI